MAINTIPTTQARAQFTSMCIDVFQDALPAPSFLRSFFPTVQEFTEYLSIQVERDWELVAVDVQRGTEGNLNTFSKSTEKVFIPPYFNELLQVSNLDLYKRAFGSTSIDAGLYSQLISDVARRLAQIRANIERRYEIQAAQVLQTGVVTCTNADNIDFRRKAASIVANGAGNTWATSTVNPFDNLADGCDFIRQVGKYGGGEFIAILGSSAMAALYNNDIFVQRVTQNLNNNIDTIMPPEISKSGARFHGVLSCRDYRVILATYPQTYDVVSGGSATATPYFDAKKVTIIPTAPRFKMGFAAVPRVLRTGTGLASEMLLEAENAVPQQFFVDDYVDTPRDAHFFRMKSAGVPVPTAVDQIYTFTPVA